MPPTRKIRRVSSGRPDGDNSVADEIIEEDTDAPEISGLVPPEVVSRIQSSERRVEDLGRRFKQVSDDAARAIGKAVQLTDELETLKNETLENMQVAFDENAEILEAIEKDVSDLKSKVGDVDSHAIEELKSVREAMESRVLELENASLALIEDVDSLKADNEGLRTGLQGALHAVDERMPEIDQKVNKGLQEAEQRMETIRHELEMALEEARKKVDASAGDSTRQLTEAVRAAEAAGLEGGSLANAFKSLAERQKSLADDIETIQSLQGELTSELKADVKALGDKVDGDLARNRESMQRFEETLSQASGAVERTQAATRQVDELEKKLQPLLEKFEESQRLVQVSRERIDVTMKLVDDVESKIRRLVAPVDDALESIEEFEAYTSEGELGFELHDLLQVMIKHNASDLHIKVGSPPTVRLDGELIPVGSEILTENDCKRLIFGAITRTQRRRLMEKKELDFAYSIPEARFRINAFLTRSMVSAAFRLLRTEMPTVEELNLPLVLKQLAAQHSGLILVTGPAGSGKSTTLASMIEHINSSLKKHVITIEDPIEFVHRDKQSIITQREIGADTPSFNDALRQALRQDPNVILIGEMRDPETIMTAAVAAETGHLVLTTLHTQNTIQAIDRMLDVFQGEHQRQFRLLLANTLRGIISQRLLQRADQQGRVAAVEVLIATPTISSLILEGKTNEIYPYLQQGATDGMQTFTSSLSRLYEQGLITKEEAMYHADQPTEFRLEVEGHTTGSAQYAEGDTLMNWL